MVRTYSELSRIPDFLGRFRYLKLTGKVGEDTFGFDRWLNQVFYRSSEWKQVRREVLLRDDACDLGHPDHPTSGRLIIHHMNPITERDIANREEILLNPEYLITVTHLTHNAIHYGDESLLTETEWKERTPNDTSPWRMNQNVLLRNS